MSEIKLGSTDKSAKDLFERFRQNHERRGITAPHVVRLFAACVHCSIRYKDSEIEEHQLICSFNPDNGWTTFRVGGKKIVEKKVVVDKIDPPDLRVAAIIDMLGKHQPILQDDAFALVKTAPNGCVEKVGTVAVHGHTTHYFKVKPAIVRSDEEWDFLDYKVLPAINKAKKAGASLDD